MAVAALLGEALRTTGSRAVPEPRQALDAALDPRTGGVCIAISHDGTTRATIHALASARESGAVTATIGVRDDSPIAAASDHVMVTPLRDRSWCHTVAYASTILAGAAIAREIAGGAAQDSSPIVETLALRPQIAQLAARLQGAQRILAVGLGADLVTARELALKIEEGARVAATALQLESLLHGHLAGCDAATTGLVLFAADPRPARWRDDRLAGAAGAARAIGIPTVALGERGRARGPSGRRRTPRTADRRHRRRRAADGRGRPPAADARARAPPGQQSRSHPARAARLSRSRGRRRDARRLVRTAPPAQSPSGGRIWRGALNDT